MTTDRKRFKRKEVVRVITSDGEVRDAIYLNEDVRRNLMFVRLVGETSTCWIPAERVKAKPGAPDE